MLTLIAELQSVFGKTYGIVVRVVARLPLYFNLILDKETD